MLTYFLCRKTDLGSLRLRSKDAKPLEGVSCERVSAGEAEVRLCSVG